MKKFLLIFLLLIGAQKAVSQTVTISRYSLTQINTEIQIKDLPDTAKSFQLKIFKVDRLIQTIECIAVNGVSDTSVVFHKMGNYQLADQEGTILSEIRILPGWFSVIPPLLAILLALLLREVIISLLAGIYLGAIFMFDFNPFTAFLRLADTLVLNSLFDKDHLIIIVFTLLFGAVIGVIAKNGGTYGISKVVVKFAKSARSGLLSTWMMGLVIFFDDYANSLIVGNMMRPITDKLRISREKLAYIVDSTAAPVASVVIISSWIGFEIGLISAGLTAINSTESAYDVFIRTIPYRFYPIAALLFVFLTSFMKRDFGPMYKAEKRARIDGIIHENDSPVEDTDSIDEKFGMEKARWWNGVIPIAIILFGTVAGLIFTGIDSLESQGIYDYSIRDIISNSDSFNSLLWASFTASLVAVFMSVSQKILKLTEAIASWSKGVQSMLFACVILVFAWTISSVTTDLKTADYLISILSDALNPRMLPILVFIICALISFSTGTSWGTMAIVMPIVIPLAVKISGVNGYDYENTTLIMHGVVSSVLAGSVFGDHCSPIADTTILSSIASRCNHIDHVKTQLPYAVFVALVCMALGDIPTAYGMSPYISLGLISIVLISALFFFGKKVPELKID